MTKLASLGTGTGQGIYRVQIARVSGTYAMRAPGLTLAGKLTERPAVLYLTQWLIYVLDVPLVVLNIRRRHRGG